MILEVHCWSSPSKSLQRSLLRNNSAALQASGIYVWIFIMRLCSDEPLLLVLLALTLPSTFFLLVFFCASSLFFFYLTPFKNVPSLFLVAAILHSQAAFQNRSSMLCEEGGNPAN